MNFSLSLFRLTGVILGLVCVSSAEDVLGRIDKNEDKRISIDEFYQTGPPPFHPRLKRVFEAHDKDKTGSLTYEQAAGAIKEVDSLEPKFTPEIDGTLADIPLDVRPRTRRAYVKATVNGVEGSFLVDTGTSDTILDADFARRAGIDFVEICLPITGGNYGKIGDFVSLIKVPQIEFAGTRFLDFHAIMRTDGKPRSDFEGRVDGIIGGNILFAKPITLDYAQSRLSFSVELTKKPDFVFDLLPQFPKIPVVDASLDGVPFNLMFDSGAALGDALLINKPYHAALRELAGDDKATDYQCKQVRVAGKLLVADKRCRLLPFQHSVIGARFFFRNLITVDKQAQKIRILASQAGAFDHEPSSQAEVQEKSTETKAYLPENMSAEQQAWEKILKENLGSFYYPHYVKDKKEGKVSAWDYVKDDPKLPRMLIIGDSISRGYTVALRNALQGKVNVHRAPANCSSTAYGLSKLDIWLGNNKEPWDLIIFNFGIHDRRTGNDQYVANLTTIVGKLKQRSNKVLFVTTTPIPEGAAEFVENASENSNRLATRVMNEHQIGTIDLYTAIKPEIAEYQLPQNCHFKEDGYTYMATYLAPFVLKSLASDEDTPIP